jgi:hypothetical protein
LELDPASKISADSFFETAGQAQLFALGVYSMLADDDLYGQKLSIIFPLDTDEGRYSTSTISDNSAVGLAHYNMSSSNTCLAATYNDLYAGISRANEAIFRIRAMPLLTQGSVAEQQLLRNLLGEMMSLRALFYFDLVKIWGDVPFVTAPTDYEQPATYYQMPRTSRDTIYDHIIADLQYAADSLDMPWRSGANTPERLHQGSVRGLLARICLHAAGYSLRWDLGSAAATTLLAKRADAARGQELYRLAHEQCQKIMSSGEHQLNPSFENIFRSYMTLTPDMTYGESMFEVGFAFANNTGGGRIGALNSCRQDANCLWGNGSGTVLALPTHYLLYEAGIDLSQPQSSVSPLAVNLLDKRRDITICNHLITDTSTFQLCNSTDYTAGKWRRYWMPATASSSADRTSVNWVMLRYSDVLLMFAEAEYFLNGNTAAARDAVNQVRRRGYGHDPETPTPVADLTTLTPEPSANPEDKICKEIVRERTLELAHEGLRKYDLIRWGIFDEKLKEVRTAMSEMASAKDPYGRTMMDAASQIAPALWPADLNYYKLGQDPALLDIKIGRDESNERARKTFASFSNDKVRIIAIDFRKLRSELYPLAQTVLDANRQLTQCPAYE